MNLARATMLVAGVSINVAWLVSVCVRSSVGAPDMNPQLAMGPLPAPPPSLSPLVIPARDPFAADVSERAPSGAIIAPSSAIGGKTDLANVNVPDVASFANSASNVGVVATIVGRDESYALVEDGAAVHVVHVGEPFGSSTVAEIAIDHIRLANGTQIAMAAHASNAPRTAGAITGPLAAPSPTPSAATSPSPAVQTERIVPSRNSSGVQLPAGTVVQPHPIIGAPAVMQPNGSPAPNLGGSLYSSFPTPSVVPIGGTIPGGRP